MAANPYIIATDDPTTAQQLAVALNARMQVMATGQSYQSGGNGSMRILTRADLPVLNETIAILKNELAMEEAAAAGVGGQTNLVRFQRAS